MSVQVKHRRDTAANIALFTPAQGEIVVDTDNKRMIVGDGSTAGGFPAAKLTEVRVAARRSVADASITANASDRTIAYTSLTAARTVTLPAASAFSAGDVLTVIDETGLCSTTNTITLARAGSDTINGQTLFALATPYGSVQLESNGVGGWTNVTQAFPCPPSPKGATVQFQWIEQLITCAGATTNIPLGATVIMFAVAVRVVTLVTGCTSITINDNQNGNGHWGSGIGLTAGSTNQGMASPGAYYNGGTTLALAAVGGAASFSGGTVRVSVLCMIVNPATS